MFQGRTHSEKVVLLTAALITAVLFSSLTFAEGSGYSSATVDEDILHSFDQGEDKVRVIVRLEDEESTQSRIQAMDTLNQDNIRHTFSSFNGFSATVTEEELEGLEKQENIERVSYDHPVTTHLDESVPLINATPTWDLQIDETNLTGKHQTICVIDTGVDYSHPDLGGEWGEKVIAGYNTYTEQESLSDEEECEDCMDYDGHGTHVAGITASGGELQGVAPDAKIAAVNVMDGGMESDIIDGIDWCVNNFEDLNISIISMSLGIVDGEENEILNDTYCDDGWPGFRDSINEAVSKNISVSISTGNSGSFTEVGVPACIENATRVGGTDKNDEVVTDWNRWDKDMLVAPGSSINSTYLNDNYGYMSGTSMAAPHVSGAVAIMNQYLSLKGGNETVSYIESKLEETGVIVEDPEVDEREYPRIDVHGAIMSMGPYFDVEIVDPDKDDRFVLGDNITINYTVENTGDEFDTQNITLNITNETGSSVFDGQEEVELGNDENYEGNFTWNTSEKEVGEYTISLRSDDEEENITIDLIQEGIFYVSIDEYEEEGVSGDVLQFNYTVDNTGSDQYYTQNITFNVTNQNGIVYNTTNENVKIDGGESYTGDFTWDTSGASTDNYSVNISSEDHYENVTVSVFEEFVLTVEKPEGYGDVFINGSIVDFVGDSYNENFLDGTEVELNATPHSGWVFGHWEEDVPEGEENSIDIKITMDDNKTLKPYFLKIYNLTMEKPEGEGNVSVNETSYNSTELPETLEFVDGDLVDIGANPEEGWFFHSWKGDINNINSTFSNDTNITVDSNYTIYPRFSRILIKTLEAEDITNQSAELHGNLTDSGDYDVNVSFRYRKTSNDEWDETEITQMEEDEEFNFTVDDLEVWEMYEFYSIGKYNESGEIKNETGEIFTFATRDFAGGNGTEENPYQIENWDQLDGIRLLLDNNFTLVDSLNETTDGYDEHANETANDGKGWDPIGLFKPEEGIFEIFDGSFDGQENKISDLYINREEEFAGLFRFIGEKAEIKNLVLEDVDITGLSTKGEQGTGTVAGASMGTLKNISASGNVGGHSTGGLVGANVGSIEKSSANITIEPGKAFASSGLTIRNEGNISESYSSGTVHGNLSSGLVGVNIGIVTDSYSTADVTGKELAGGLVAINGFDDKNGSINRTYATGVVYSEEDAGGLVGNNTELGQINYSFWDINTTTQANALGHGNTSENSIGLKTEDITGEWAEGNMTGFDFEDRWNITTDVDKYGRTGYPHLSWQTDNYPYPRASPVARTHNIGNRETDSAVLKGELAYVGLPEEVNFSFIWKEDGGEWQNTTVEEGTNTTDILEYSLSGLEEGTNYEYYAYAEGIYDDDLFNDSGTVKMFTTLKEAYFEVEITNYDDEVEEGDTVSVDYEVENIGDKNGTRWIDFEVADDLEAYEEIELDGKETKSGTFEWDTEEGDKGDHDIRVVAVHDEEEEGEDEVTVTVTETEDDEEGEDDALPEGWQECDYTDWEDEECGGWECDQDEMYQTRSSDVDGCDDTERCIEMTDVCGIPKVSLELEKSIANVTQGGNTSNELMVENTGTEDISDLRLHLIGDIHTAWYTKGPVSMDLNVGETGSFVVDFTVDDLAIVGKYPLTYKVNTTGYYRSIEGELWVHPGDDTKKQIENNLEDMENKVSDLESKIEGSDEDLEETTQELRKIVDEARQAIEDENHIHAKELLDKASDLYSESEEDIERIEERRSWGWIIWIILVSVLVLSVVSVYYYALEDKNLRYDTGKYSYGSHKKKGLSEKIKSLGDFSDSSSKRYGHTKPEGNILSRKLESLKNKFRKWKKSRREKQTKYSEF